jgi:hypothetical protein
MTMLRWTVKMLHWINNVSSVGRGLGWLAIFGGAGWLLFGDQQDPLTWATNHWWLMFIGPALLVGLEQWKEHREFARRAADPTVDTITGEPLPHGSERHPTD